MKDVLRWIIIVALVSVYVFALFAVLHPHVSAAYKAYYIDRTSDDYSPTVYNTTPEQGMTFGQPGIPQWVLYTRGFSVRDPWGRWTDQNLNATAGLRFNQKFDGDLCVDTTIRAVPWVVGDTIMLRMGQREQPLRVQSEGPTEYRVQLTDLHGANELDFVLPPKLPAVVERVHDSSDPRRLGVNVASLRLLPGGCSALTSEAGGSK